MYRGVDYHAHPVIEGENTIIKYVGFYPQGDIIYTENRVIRVEPLTDEKAKFVFECDERYLNRIAQSITRKAEKNIENILQELKKIKEIELQIGKEKAK
jgi:hypothetical protein